MNKGHFKKGQIPWNKGKKHPTKGRAVLTQFKPGEIPATAREIGSIRFNKENHIELKFDERNDWGVLHRKLWSFYNSQEIPKDCVVKFADGNSFNISPDNLILMTRAELMKANSVRNYPKELQQVIQLRGAINRKINGK